MAEIDRSGSVESARVIAAVTVASSAPNRRGDCIPRGAGSVQSSRCDAGPRRCRVALGNMDKRRTARVSEAVREELAEIIGFEMNDPRVKCGNDCRRGRHAGRPPSARQRRHLRRRPNNKKRPSRRLNHARAHLRHQLAARLQLRHVPELHLHADSGTAALQPRRSSARTRQEKQARPGKCARNLNILC